MSNLTEQIDSIIKSRKEKIKFIDNTIEHYKKCCTCIYELKKIQNDNDITDEIKAIPLDKYYDLADKYKTALEKLKSRFSRDNLHISLVGSARQGKSLVIQKISGLDKNIIPSSDGSDCTGTKSIITNTDSNEVKAEITFYNDVEMIKIVNKYIESICHSKEKCIHSISEIHLIPIKEISESIKDSIDERSYLYHLKNYVNHIAEIKDYLGKTITISKNEIEEYVAQYKHDDFNTKYFKYLGVKLANIKCSFPYKEAGKIVLIDTIGIGTTSLGVESDMLDTIENDSDTIIFMFRPDPLGPRLSKTETDIIKKISVRVTNEYAKEMLFWVINKVEDGKGRNIDYISGVIDQIKALNFPVSEILPVNCISKEEVENGILKVVLNKMASRIDAVDKLLIKKTNEQAMAFYNEFDKIASVVCRVVTASVNEDLKRKLNPEIDDTIEEKLLNEIRKLYLNKYNNLREKPCKTLEKASEETLSSMFNFIPKKEKIIISLLNRGTVNQHNAIEKCADTLRLKIIDAFNELDKTLEKQIVDMKKEVINIIAGKDFGKFSYVAEYNNNPNEWIENFLIKTEADKKYPIISKAMNDFKNFKCTVQGFLIYEIRDKLDKIDFSLRKVPPFISNSMDKPEEIAEEIIEFLNDCIYEIYNEIKKAIVPLYKIPNRAMFAAIKDLYDRLALDDRKTISNESVKTEWRYMYEEWMRFIWSEEYNNYMSIKSKTEIINNLVKNFKECNVKSLFNINFK